MIRSRSMLTKLTWKVLAIGLLAAAAAGLLLLETASAQEGPEYQYVDLVMTYEDSGGLDIYYRVRNVGTQTATGVAVSFLLEDVHEDTFELLNAVTNVFLPIPPTITNNKTVDQTNQTFTWEIGTLSPGETSRTLSFNPSGHPGLTDTNQIGVVTATAKSHQPEPGFLSSNNVASIYLFVGGAQSTGKLMIQNRLALLLSVDDLRPSAGGNVDFGLTIDQLDIGFSNSPKRVDDIEIRVELSDGLQFKSTTDWTRPAGFTTVGQSATWTPEAVDSASTTSTPPQQEIDIEVQLTSDTLDAIPLEERCITAWLEDSKPRPNPDYPLHRFTQCLGTTRCCFSRRELFRRSPHILALTLPGLPSPPTPAT